MRALLIAAPMLLVAAAPVGAKPDHVAGIREEDPPAKDAQITEATATASTTLCEKKPKLCHGPELLLDGKPETAWCEGLPGDGQGATITITFAKAETLDQLFIVPHFARNFALAEQNNRIKTLQIDTDGDDPVIADLDDMAAYVKQHNPVREPSDGDTCGDEDCAPRDDRIQDVGQWVELPGSPTKKLVLTIKDVYRGSKYHDLCASELRVYRAR